MKLFILRHGEAEPGGKGSDFDRHLTNSGKETVKQVGERISQAGLKFDLVLCSTAKRTKETIDLVLAQFAPASETKFIDSLYNARLNQVLDLLAELDGKYKQVLLVGHNPSFSELAAYLLGTHFISLSPGQLMGFELTIENWEELTRGSGSLIEK